MRIKNAGAAATIVALLIIVSVGITIMTYVHKHEQTMAIQKSVNTVAMSANGEINGIQYSSCETIRLKDTCYNTKRGLAIRTFAPIEIGNIRVDKQKSALRIIFKGPTGGLCKRLLTIPASISTGVKTIVVEIGTSKVAEFDLNSTGCIER